MFNSIWVFLDATTLSIKTWEQQLCRQAVHKVERFKNPNYRRSVIQAGLKSVLHSLVTMVLNRNRVIKVHSQMHQIVAWFDESSEQGEKEGRCVRRVPLATAAWNGSWKRLFTRKVHSLKDTRGVHEGWRRGAAPNVSTPSIRLRLLIALWLAGLFVRAYVWLELTHQKR